MDITQWGVHSPGTLRDSFKGSLETGHLSMGALLRELGGGLLASGPEVYERKAVEIGIPLYGGSVGQPGVGSSSGDFEIWLKGALEVGCLSLSLCGSSVKGTWRESSLVGDPEGYVEKALKTGISFHRDPVWGTGRRARLSGTLRAV